MVDDYLIVEGMPLNMNVVETEIYKNPFSTYQDMVDGDFIIENSDSEPEPDSESEFEEDKKETEIDDVEKDKVEYVDNINDEGIVDKTQEEEEEYFDDVSAVSDVSDGPNTITVISTLFGYCKKVSNANRTLKLEVDELKKQMEDNKRQLDFFDNVIQFFVLATIFHFATVQIKLNSIN